MNKKASYAFRILAGAYLIYLGYSLIKGYLVEHEVSAGFMAVGILFGALGLFFCVTGLMGRRRADQEMREAQERPPEPLPQPMEDTETEDVGEMALEDGATEKKEEEEV